MPEFCTCGSQLPPDALFCHKCGKPQREIVEPEAVAPVRVEAPASAPPPSLALPPLDFRNRIAVRIGLLVAIGATLLSFIPFLNWVAAGFVAVYFYRRKTGSKLNVKAGVRMGWITGVLMFPMWAVIFTAQKLPDALSGRLATALQEQMKSWPYRDPVMQEATRFLSSGPGLAALMLFSLAFLFVSITCLSMAGGALGAKVVGRG